MTVPHVNIHKAIPAISSFGNIAASLRVVEQWRQLRQADPALQQATTEIKRWQSQRFHDCYADLLKRKDTAPASRFFLTELYSEQDFSLRDRQFARIAGAIERLFPQSVVQTTQLLAQLHALSETIDAHMAQLWSTQQQTARSSSLLAPALEMHNYQALWQSLSVMPGYDAARVAQIETACQLGRQLYAHTRMPGLRLMLKMMRSPASAAGLSQLQSVLETGFDTFAQLGRSGSVDEFLGLIETRERAWLAQMNDSPP